MSDQGPRPPSRAFQQAVDEVTRIWNAADHLDTKILQFAAIVSAGFLAAAGFSAQTLVQLPLAGGGWCAGLVGALLALGLAAYVAFFGLLVTAAIGTTFGAPLDPRRLGEHPEYLNDDARFERDMLPHIATAFEASRRGLEDKVRRFRQGITALGMSFICFAVATLLIVCCLHTGRSSSMRSEETDTPAPSAPQPAQPDVGIIPSPAPQPGLAPYEVERGVPRLAPSRPAVPAVPDTDITTRGAQ